DNYSRHADACRNTGVDVPAVVPIMRTVFVSDDGGTLARVRELLAAQVTAMRAQANDAMRARMPERVDDWSIVGTPDEVSARIDLSRRELGMTHLIATRLRIGGIETELLQQSLRMLADGVGAAAHAVTMGRTP